MEYICLLTYGKGRVEGNEAETAKVYTFDTLRDAEIFKNENEFLDSKFWQKVDILKRGEIVELGYPKRPLLPESEGEYMRRRNTPVQQ